MIDNINFKGAFLIKHPAPEGLHNNILKTLGEKRGKQVIPNMSDKGDILYVTREHFDKDIAGILMKTKNAKFKYYPTMSTKSGFDDEKPLEAKKILRKAANKVIDTKQKLETFFRQKFKKPVNIVAIQADNLKTIEKATLIDINANNYRTNIDHQSGICSVYTMTDKIKNGKKVKVRHTLISITPPDMYGISYAKVKPLLKTSDDKMRWLAIRNGNIILEYKEPGSKKFMENSEAAKRHYINTLEKYKSDMAAFKTEFA